MKSSSLFLAAALAASSAAAIAAPAATAAKPAATAAKPTAIDRAGYQQAIGKTFKSIDADNDGLLNSAELAAAEGKVQQARITRIRQNYDAQFSKMDTNKDGQLSKVEFMATAPTTAQAKPNGAALVGQLDLNKDGKVNLQEYSKPPLANFDKSDKNKDGKLTPDERGNR